MEGVVGKGVAGVPGHFCSEKIFEVKVAHDLRELRCVAEGVGKPKLLTRHPKFLFKKVHSVEKLPHQSLRASQVHVRCVCVCVGGFVFV